MHILYGLIFTAMLISIIMAMLPIMTAKKTNKDREKLSPFECGFDPFKSSHAPFSLRFFIITVIFLTFEVELTLLLPLGLLAMNNNYYYIMLMALIITMILIMGLIHEWVQGTLNWAQ
uniref:NADH-ubiquinone oxidoreductase chain 3 n=1 Tax=Haploginglymus sp. JP-2016 TaxID=1867951 RepID=A0A330IX25_9CRUS|nr:ND3 [Haploginglymus sp. JP-2016]